MTLNELLQNKNIDPRQVFVLRHRPSEPALHRVLPWLAADKPHLFNAYQQTQPPQLEKALQQMIGKGYVASFIGRAPGTALFVGKARQ